MDSSVLFGVATIAYIFAMMAYIAYLVTKVKPIGQAATTITVIGFVSQTLAFILRWKEFYEMNIRLGLGESILRATPLTNLYESLIFFVWCLILGYLIVEFKYKNRSFGAFITPVAGLTLAFIEMAGVSKDLQPLVPALQSNWLLAHVFMTFVSYSCFGLSFGTALMYLIITTDRKTEPSYIIWTVTLGMLLVVLVALGLDYLKFNVAGMKPDELIQNYLFRATFFSPSKVVAFVSFLVAIGALFAIWNWGGALRRIIEGFGIQTGMLDEITYKSIAIGFPIFTIGGLIFGAIWADQAWGVYWSWDPKETWSLITWFVYAFFLHARLLRGWRGHKMAVVAVIGFISVVFTYLGVNLLLSGLHAYGSG
jgi:ABC-type transport system involved in cytochrome c biogenesis permease subunit